MNTWCYLAHIIGGIHDCFVVYFAVFVAVMAVMFIFSLGDDVNYFKKYADKLNKYYILFILSILGMIFIPSKDSFIFMIGC